MATRTERSESRLEALEEVPATYYALAIRTAHRRAVEELDS
jgi:hypothetical protein